jgi:hypothetical protein
MFDARHAEATAAAAEITDSTPDALLRRHVDFMEPLCALPWWIDVRFGRWEAIIERPPPADAAFFALTSAVAHWAKAVALGALGRLCEAREARSAFAAAREAVPAARHIHMVPSHRTLEVAAAMLDGELEYRAGRFGESFALLRRAVALEDALPYDEPPGWLTPVRHALGALMFERSRAADAADSGALAKEAEDVFRADLERHPRNMWALCGLHECLSRRGAHEADEVGAALERARARADVPIGRPCFCARGGQSIESAGGENAPCSAGPCGGA